MVRAVDAEEKVEWVVVEVEKVARQVPGGRGDPVAKPAMRSRLDETLLD